MSEMEITQYHTISLAEYMIFDNIILRSCDLLNLNIKFKYVDPI